MDAIPEENSPVRDAQYWIARSARMKGIINRIDDHVNSTEQEDSVEMDAGPTTVAGIASPELPPMYAVDGAHARAPESRLMAGATSSTS